MAIAPSMLNERFMDEVDEFEKKLDSTLQTKRLVPGTSLVISVPKGMTYGHFELLKKRYIQVGWKELDWVSFYDQRDQYDYTTIEFKS